MFLGTLFEVFRIGLLSLDCICRDNPCSWTRKIFERPKSMSLRHFSSTLVMKRKFSGFRSLVRQPVPMADSVVVAIVDRLDDLPEDLSAFEFIEILAVDDAVEKFATFADSSLFLLYSRTRYMFLSSSKLSYSRRMFGWSSVFMMSTSDLNLSTLVTFSLGIVLMAR